MARLPNKATPADIFLERRRKNIIIPRKIYSAKNGAKCPSGVTMPRVIIRMSKFLTVLTKSVYGALVKLAREGIPPKI